jgi:hypothetical protein
MWPYPTRQEKSASAADLAYRLTHTHYTIKFEVHQDGMVTKGTRIAKDTVEFQAVIAAEYRDATYIHFEVVAQVQQDDDTD